MQYAVFPMPPNPIRSIDRRLSFSTDRLLWQIEPSSSFHNDHQYQDIRLGTSCGDLPDRTYKAIYISNDSEYVFEVVYVKERGLERCIYVKMIGRETNIGVPFDTILNYSHSPGQLVPLSTIINEANWMRNKCRLVGQDIQFIIPVLCGREDVDREIVNLLGNCDGDTSRNLVADTWEPLYHHEPNLLGALIKGTFFRAPHNELQGTYPVIQPLPTRYSDAYNLSYRSKALGGKIYCDQSEFDAIILSLIKFDIPEFSLTVSFTDGLEGIINTGVINHFHDPYQHILLRPQYSQRSIFVHLGGIVQEVLWRYSQVFDCDLYRRPNRIDRSYVTISKNMFDEVILEFRDQVEGNHIGIYGNMTSLALSTHGVGYKHRAM